MQKPLPLIAALILAGAVAAVPAIGQQRGNGGANGGGGDQANARAELQAGRNLPIREIERRILPTMRGDEYLGFEYDSTAQAYRLKFIREGRMIWVDVDAQTARVLRVSQ